MKQILFFLVLGVFLVGCQEAPKNDDSTSSATTETASSDSLIYPAEKHFKNIKQLTFGGDNAEAYFSFDSKHLIAQITNPAWEIPCDQIFTMPITGYEGERPKMLSTGKGRTTCSYFLPGDTSTIYSSTHL